MPPKNNKSRPSTTGSGSQPGARTTPITITIPPTNAASNQAGPTQNASAPTDTPQAAQQANAASATTSVPGSPGRPSYADIAGSRASSPPRSGSPPLPRAAEAMEGVHASMHAPGGADSVLNTNTTDDDGFTTVGKKKGVYSLSIISKS
ncbi:hypothetical protein D9758_017590 [Tetrapyrgos nigripes]|uniref:Uncharacterized protein n=1 Tax=Tetrapyrgos nigripes TaxID=182062 RepID=A0A8H5C3A8_9AGAR|nr:hypothetical protein D9758_017590 [Tetrapyrgos nigripes]